jgi:hypothetical protein
MRQPYTFILLLFIGLTISDFASACDQCGCGNGGSFFGILPQSHRGFMGFRYKQSSFDSHPYMVLSHTKETFQSTEAWGRFYPFKKVQVLAFLPYNINTQTIYKTNQTTTIRGIGDATLLAYYNLRNTFWDSTNHTITQNLLVGGGIKLPTGRYHYDPLSTAEVDNPNFQLGTGSTDFLLNIIYTVRYKELGINTDITYKINTTNSNQYRFGNRFTVSSSLFWSKVLGNITLMPHTGIYFEYSTKNAGPQLMNIPTGGYLTMANVGIDCYIGKWGIDISNQIPIVQDLSADNIQAHSRSNIHLTYLF